MSLYGTTNWMLVHFAVTKFQDFFFCDVVNTELALVGVEDIHVRIIHKVSRQPIDTPTVTFLL